MGLVGKIKLRKFRKEWRKKNSHNKTIATRFFDMDLVSVGKGTYGPLTVFHVGKQSKLQIGSYCSIAAGVSFVFNNEHPMDRFSTYPFKAMLLNEKRPEAESKGGIVIGDDVWIGQNALILDGVKVGQGAVIAAGSVVSKNVPAYAVVGGVPAKLIKYRFEKDIVDALSEICWADVSSAAIEENIDLLYKRAIELSDVEALKEAMIKSSEK